MEVPRHWRLQKQRYLMVGEVCPHCEEKVFPPREACPVCAEKMIMDGYPVQEAVEADAAGLKSPLTVGMQVPVN